MSSRAVRIAAIGVLLILSFQGLKTLWKEGDRVVGVDFYQYWVGTRMARETTDFYAPATRQRMGVEYLHRAEASGDVRRILAARERQYLDTVGTPLLYVFASVLRGSYDTNVRVFQLVMLAALIATFLILRRTHDLDAVLALALFVLVCLAFRATLIDALVVNVNKLLLLCVAGSTALVARKQFALAGVLLVIATLMKPNIAPVLPLLLLFLLLQKRMRELTTLFVSALGASIAAFVASSLYFRSWTIWFEWLEAFRTMPDSVTPTRLGNFALSRLLAEQMGFHASPLLLLLFLGIAIAIGWQARANPRLAITAIPLGCVLFLLVSPLTWIHYYLLAIPMIALLLRRPDDVEPPQNVRMRFTLAIVATFILAMEPWGGTSAIGIVPLVLICNAGLLLLYVAALLDLRGATASASSSAVR